jgi:hypothetical protein
MIRSVKVLYISYHLCGFFLLKLFIHIEPLCIAHLITQSFYVIQQHTVRVGPLFRGPLQQLDEIIVPLFLDEELKPLDFFVVLARANADALDLAVEGRALCGSAVMHEPALLNDLGQFLLHARELSEVFLLHLRVLDFDNC